MSDSPLLVANEISLKYGRRVVLADVAVQLRPGVAGLIGPNGAGKTSLVRVLAGVVRPETGSIQVAGHDLMAQGSRPAALAALGYMPQASGLIPHMSVTSFLRYAAWLRKVPGDEVENAVASAIELTDLGRWATDKIKGLSGGTRQRLGLAQALIHNPRVLLLDEPVASRDVGQRRAFYERVRSSVGQQQYLSAATSSMSCPSWPTPYT